MNGKTFVDSNVLIYAHDAAHPKKQETAARLLSELWKERSGVLSAQVLQEFYVNITRKVASPLPKKTARLVVNNYFAWCLDTVPADIAAAFRIEDEARIGFWDALLVASAVRAGATRILTEDLNSGQTISGIRIKNPFA
jgi:predicted nucleic acid-binding protein